MKISVNRQDTYLFGDEKRVIAKLFFNGAQRAELLVRRVLALSDEEVDLHLGQILRDFAARHRNITEVFERHFTTVMGRIDHEALGLEHLGRKRRLLLGGYFTHEYSIEAAAFFNPSLVIAPYQTNLTEGELRLVMSMRATGEGHISSLEFRELVLDADNQVRILPAANRIEQPEFVRDHIYTKQSFCRKLQEMGVGEDVTGPVTERLGDQFIYRELREAIQAAAAREEVSEKADEIQEILWLADAHHQIQFSLDTDLSERIIYPVSEWESRGIEDARFVRFEDDDGEIYYYGTYTAYDGHRILPKLVKTRDFYDFQVMPLYGDGAQNKNLALFPRKVNGRYVMLARIDGQNNYIMYSDKLNVWEDPRLLMEPAFPWEYIQVGNCGSPIETDSGWLLITHGVGAMRKYCIGAVLLDLNDPSKIIGRLPEPLLRPLESEREGYVPNVVYSCGSIINKGELLIPFAISDYATTFATVDLETLLQRLLQNPVRETVKAPPLKEAVG